MDYLNDLKLGPADWMADVLKANYACARDPRATWIPADTPACEVKGTMSTNDVAVSSVPPAVLAQMLRSDAPPLLLDVREKEELAGKLGALPGVVHVPIAGVARRLGELERHREREKVVVCRSGGRAQTAAQILGAATKTSAYPFPLSSNRITSQSADRKTLQGGCQTGSSPWKTISDPYDHRS